ncbi:bifunctional riboflavin kinase/FAD synthetase [candidate division WOR-3 bacterium]|nr:bifunctional riboflavin kinase/FAD synthetase [candidate division WOR-3 bacterium]
MQSNQSKFSLIHNLNELPSVSGFLAMGNFDGVHLGHQLLIEEGNNKGDVSVLTYEPHPLISLDKISEPFLLTTISEKIFLLERYSVKKIVFLNFDSAVAQMSAENFVDIIIKKKMNPSRVIIGFDHRFGKDREGNSDFLKSMGEKLGFEVTIFPEVKIDNEPVKSSTVRKLLKIGDMDGVYKLLRHPYLIEGKVVKGDGVGGSLGYPTANIQLDSNYKLLPCEGLYSSIVEIKGEEFPAMLYIGSSPTLGIDYVKIEIHIMGFSEDIYGEKIKCFVYSLIRKKKFFSSKQSLREDIKKSEEETLRSLKEVSKWK